MQPGRLRNASSLIRLRMPRFLPLLRYGGYTVTEQVGSTASGVAIKEKPVGTTVYNGAPLTGAGYSLELLAAPGMGLHWLT